jgi:CPA1 family monovalent cation:H+ antiporter
MHSFSIEITVMTILLLVIVSNAISSKLKIPSVFLLLGGSYSIYAFFPQAIPIDLKTEFDSLVIFAIPLIFMADALHLHFEDIRHHWFEIFYLAVVSVAISIAAGASLYYFDLFAGLSLGAYVTLFAINMATDAVSVQSILSQFSGIEHRTKVLIEGESLGNDATAVIAFFFIGLPWMVHGEMSVATAAMASFKVFSLSTLLGLGVGFGFYLFLKLFDDKRSEFFAFVVEAYAAYVLAEHFHISGILTLIVAVVTTKFFIDRDIDLHKQALAHGDGKYSRQYRRKLLNRFVATTHERMEYIYEMAREFGYIAAVVIFFLLAEMVDFSTLLSYWKEIVMMFGITTLIRALSMAKFAFLGDKTEAIKPVGIRGWFILTFSGMKGALSIILVHMLPHDLPYRQLFESVTIGVVVLSIFVYGTILWFYFMFFDKSLEEKRN